jgi:hypothetical protein
VGTARRESHGWGPVEQIAGWLENLGLRQYAKLFAENDIDGSVRGDPSWLVLRQQITRGGSAGGRLRKSKNRSYDVAQHINVAAKMPAMEKSSHSSMAGIIKAVGASQNVCLRIRWTKPTTMLIAMKARHPKRKIAKATSRLVCKHA